MPDQTGNGQPGELVDLDAWLEEEAAKAPRIKLFGEVVALPADIPFDVQLAAWRLAQEHGDDYELDPEQLTEFIGRYVGAETVARWRRDHDVGDRTLAKVLEVIVGHYQEPDAPGGDGQGEVVALNRATRRAAAKTAKKRAGGSRASSRTGSSSRRTSSGSTGSTSRRSGGG